MTDRDLSLVDTSDGLQVILDGRALYDESPATSAREKAQSVPVLPDTLYLVVSPAAWHGVETLKSRLPDSSTVVAVEADPVLLELSRRLAESPPNPMQTPLCTPHLASVHDALAELDPRGEGAYRRVRQVSFARSAAAGGQAYRALREALESNIRTSWQNRLTLSEMARLWFSNMFRNLPGLAAAIPIPSTNGPVIVCGAGPSLDSAIDFLVGERSRVTILAVDTALPALIDRGVVPDYVVAVEAQFRNVRDFLVPDRDSYRVIADITSSPVVVGSHKPAQIHWMCASFAVTPLLDRLRSAELPLRTIDALGSVGVTAVQLALNMTGGPVLLTGLDFALFEQHNGKPTAGTHARGTAPANQALIQWGRFHPPAPAALLYRLVSATGVNGEAVPTSLPMIGYAEQLAALIREDHSARPARAVVTLNPGGLSTGARSVGLDEAKSIVAMADEVPERKMESATHRDYNAPEATERIESFLLAEQSRLETLKGALRAELAGDARPDLEHLFRTCDYVALGMADYTGTLRKERGFLSRILVAVNYYEEQIGRLVKRRPS